MDGVSSCIHGTPAERPTHWQNGGRQQRSEADVIPWVIVDAETAPSGTRLELARRGGEWEVRADRTTLMSNRQHGSEETMAQLALRAVPRASRILLGGLGLGYSLRATLDLLPPTGKVVLAELSPAVVRWNRTHLADLAGRPLDDPRVSLFEGDVRDCLRGRAVVYDAILLDVDNGPNSLVHEPNAGLYTRKGVQACFEALRAPGILVVWSLTRDEPYLRRLRGAGFAASEHLTPARPGGGRKKHVLLVGVKWGIDAR
jgi:spermidine synthase